MKTIAYASPFIPPEWIAAHRFQPRKVEPRPCDRQGLLSARRGVCPYARAVADTVLAGLDAAAVILTTACDQMRFAAALLERRGSMPIFLLNMPSTWETPQAMGLYRDELERLGRFMERLGGVRPSADDLARVMLEHDARRAPLRGAPDDLDGHVRLALVGGPLMDQDQAVLDAVTRGRGRIVLDATEGGRRALPAEFNRRRIEDNPLGELASAYFVAIPGVFRRPNDGLRRWLSQQIADCHVRGILFRRYVSCDLWHAELHHLRQWSPVPVLEIDFDHDDQGALPRALARVEAFLEILP